MLALMKFYQKLFDIKCAKDYSPVVTWFHRRLIFLKIKLEGNFLVTIIC